MKLAESKIYQEVKGNLNLILVIPAFFGGIWQVIELSSISTAFIRFFSVSQMVADGILILFLLVFGYIGIKIAMIFFKDNGALFDFNVDAVENHKRLRTINIALFILSGIVILWQGIPALIELYNTKRFSPGVLLLVIPFIVILSSIFVTSCVSILLSLGVKFIIKNENLARFLKGMLAILIFVIGVKGLVFFMTAFHGSFLVSDNVKNLTYVKCFIIHQNSDAIDIDVRYFNDKYLFVEFSSKGVKQLEVLPFSTFIDGSSCDPIQTEPNQTE